MNLKFYFYNRRAIKGRFLEIGWEIKIKSRREKVDYYFWWLKQGELKDQKILHNSVVTVKRNLRILMTREKDRRRKRLPGENLFAKLAMCRQLYFSKRTYLRNFPLRKRVTTRAITTWILLSLHKRARVYGDASESNSSKRRSRLGSKNIITIQWNTNGIKSANRYSFLYACTRVQSLFLSIVTLIKFTSLKYKFNILCKFITSRGAINLFIYSFIHSYKSNIS